MRSILGQRLPCFCRHEWMHRREPGRWWLECFKCGRTTHGVALAAPDHATRSAAAVTGFEPLIWTERPAILR
jgi:hypothetical protein